MPRLSAKSKEKLATCHPDLQMICNELIKTFDFSVAEGHRGKAAQDEAYRRRASKLKYPNSKHNKKPSLAVDIYPYPFPGWDEKSMPKWKAQRKAFLEVAKTLGISIRTISWDWPHFELKGK